LHSFQVAPFSPVLPKRIVLGERTKWNPPHFDLEKAIRGRVRGEYYIQGDIREEFKRIANSIEAEISVTKLGDVESAYRSRILGKQRTSLPPTLTGGSILDETIAPHAAIPLELHEKIADINDAIQRIENQIQIAGPEGNIAPVTNVQSQIKEEEGNRADWQEVLVGFQLYRDIFQMGMDSPKTQDGLYAALGEISKRGGLTEKEILDKMDAALKIARKYARIWK